MKLRIKGDSIRLRLMRTEVAALRSGGRIEETVHLTPDHALVYALARGAHEGVRVTFDGREACVHVSAAILEAWTTSDEVGFQRDVPVGPNRALCVLVEKDWQCLTGRDEDERDAYPNPNTGC